jgi:hypothetical protein
MAMYRTDLQIVPQLVVNDEALAFLWWGSAVIGDRAEKPYQRRARETHNPAAEPMRLKKRKHIPVTMPTHSHADEWTSCLVQDPLIVMRDSC